VDNFQEASAASRRSSRQFPPTVLADEAKIYQILNRPVAADAGFSINVVL
jgi:hypothetical protein